MEVTNLGVVGSLEPIEKLLDAYSNNSEDRKNLIISQLTSNPFDIKLPESSEKQGNDNMMLNSYLSGMGVKFEKSYPEDKYDKINENLSTDDIILLGEIIEMYNVDDKDLDIEHFIDNLDEYRKELDEHNKVEKE